MTEIIVNVVLDVLAYWILIFIMQYICSAHIRLSKGMILSCTALNLLVNALFTEFSITCMLALIALTVLIFSVRKGRDLLLFFPAFAIYFVLTVIPQCILEELFPKYDGHVLIGEYSVSLVGLGIDIALLTVLIILRHVLLKYESTIGLNTKEILGCIALLFFALIDVALLISTSRSGMRPFFSCLWKTIFVSAFVFSLGYYLFSLIEHRVRIYRQSISRSEQEYLQVQLDSLQDIRENEAQVKHLRHDLSNHLSVIQSLCEDGNYEEIKSYTQRLRNDIVLTGSDVLTGNKVADLVVSSKRKTAEAHHIDFTFTGSLQYLTAMEPPDICGLLSNAYDNAIEACLSLEQPYIRTEVSSTRNYTVIRIVNSVSEKISVRGNHVATTKKDKLSHGYGIDIMKRIAHKYNGSCTVSSSETEFTVKIVLLNS